MRALLPIFLFLLLAPCLHAETTVTGAWSEPENGLKARLIITEGRLFSGTRIPEIYLELYNSSDVINPIQFVFNFSESLKFELHTADGKPVPDASGDADGFVQNPVLMTIMNDGTVRFPVTWNGYGVPRDYGTFLGFYGPAWKIPYADKADYFLSAVFTIPKKPREEGKEPDWQGTIKIPALKVPTKR